MLLLASFQVKNIIALVSCPCNQLPPQQPRHNRCNVQMFTFNYMQNCKGNVNLFIAYFKISVVSFFFSQPNLNSFGVCKQCITIIWIFRFNADNFILGTGKHRLFIFMRFGVSNYTPGSDWHTFSPHFDGSDKLFTIQSNVTAKIMKFLCIMCVNICVIQSSNEKQTVV